MKKILIVFLLFTGCLSAPSKEDYVCPECFNHAFCLYLNQKNPDKSACSARDAECAEATKIKQNQDIMEFCREYCLDGVMTEDYCRLLLNQN